MSYVTLNAQFPMGATQYEECTLRNTALEDAYAPKLAAWQAAKANYDAYVKRYNAWKKEHDRWRGKAIGVATSYASAMASYSAAMKTYKEKLAAFNAAVAYNTNLDAADIEAKAKALENYDIVFMGGANCVDPTQKAEISRACEQSQVKGIGLGLYLFDLKRTNPCILDKFNVCKPRKVATHPGNPPKEPVKGTVPDPPVEPTPVTDPGPAPPGPQYEKCQESAAGGIATFGLLAILIVGGGALGYRQWKKRKRAA